MSTCNWLVLETLGYLLKSSRTLGVEPWLDGEADLFQLGPGYKYQA